MQVSSERVKQDLNAVATDTEQLIKSTANTTNERLNDIRARAQESVKAAQQGLLAARDGTQTYVRDNPWTAVGVAAGVGILLGILLRRN
jgi:ElaB/YqjD/DUF883 family membrane-anchored ribosome-binding protein